MKKNISLAIFGIFLIFLVSASLVSASVDAVVNYKPTASSKMVSKGDSFDVALIGIGNGEKLNLEKLELRGPSNYLVLEEYASGTDNSGYGIYTYGKQVRINTANYNAGTYKIRLTIRGAQTGQVKYDEIDLIINSPPVVTILTPADGNSFSNKQNTVTYTATDINGNLDKCWATNGAITTPKTSCTGLISGLNSVVGSNTWTVYAQDTLGDIGSASTTFTIISDANAPTITISTPVNGNTYNTPVTRIVFTPIDAEGNLRDCWYSTNGGILQTTPTACTNGVLNSFSGLNSNIGVNNWVVYARDTFGNMNSVAFSYTYSPDTTAPTITISAPINGNTYNTPVTQIDFTPVDAEGNLDQCWYSLNGGTTISTPVTCTDSALNSFTGITSIAGLNNWVVYAKDLFGNIGSTAISFTQDTTAPVITALDPMNGDDLNDNDVILSVSTNENSIVTYSLNGATNVTMTQSLLLIFESANLNLDYDESYSVTYYATDLAGNKASLTINFDINEDDDNGNSNYDGDSFYQTQFTNQYNPLNPSIDLTDDTTTNGLNLWQRFVNWLCRLFGLEEIY